LEDLALEPFFDETHPKEWRTTLNQNKRNEGRLYRRCNYCLSPRTGVGPKGDITEIYPFPLLTSDDILATDHEQFPLLPPTSTDSSRHSICPKIQITRNVLHLSTRLIPPPPPPPQRLPPGRRNNQGPLSPLHNCTILNSGNTGASTTRAGAAVSGERRRGGRE